MTEQDLNTRVETTSPYRVIFVDKYEDDQVWFSLQVSGGGANCTLSHKQARELVAALNRVLEAE